MKFSGYPSWRTKECRHLPKYIIYFKATISETDPRSGNERRQERQIMWSDNYKEDIEEYSKSLSVFHLEDIKIFKLEQISSLDYIEKGKKIRRKLIEWEEEIDYE